MKRMSRSISSPAKTASNTFEPISRPESLPEQIYRTVHEKIASGDLDPSQRITETRLAEMLGVSRTPVREALVRLRREGLLDGSPKGSVIASLSRADLEEIMEVRDLVDPYIAARAAERAEPDGVERLKNVLAAEEAAMTQRSGQAFSMANHDFRVTLTELAGNSRLSQTASRYDSQLQLLRRATLEKRANRELVVRHHKRLVAAIAKGDTVTAEKVMRDLITHASGAILALGDEKSAKRTTRGYTGTNTRKIKSKDKV